MRPLLHICVICLLTICSISCKSNSNPTSNNSIQKPDAVQPEDQQSELKLLQEGYVKAVILDKKSSYDCGFLLKLEDSGSLLYPLKMDKRYQTDHLKVWLRYRPIRPIQANCPDAKPIHIEGMQKRNF